MFIKKIKNLRLFERRLLLKSLKSRLFITGLLILSLYAVLSTTLCKFDKTASLNAPSLLELKPTTTPFYKI